MCSEYHVKTNLQELANELQESIQEGTDKSVGVDWDLRVKFTRSAPVVVYRKAQFFLESMVFPANPFPNSRLSQIQSNKISSHLKSKPEIEQIVRIYEVPLWKEGFTKHPCLIPMTSFFEPAYWGENAGDIMEFKDPERRITFVPGFVIKPRVPMTDRWNGFTLLTHTATEQMLNFHHRQIVQLEPKSALEYLTMEIKDPLKRFDYVLKNRLVPHFHVTKERSMAKGWDKRIDQHLQALEDEKAYLKTLKKEDVLA